MREMLHKLTGEVKESNSKLENILKEIEELKQSRHQLEDALDVGLEIQALVHRCVLTYIKFIISFRTHRTSAVGRTRQGALSP